MSTVFFTADPHFGHTNIIRYENRPFASAEEMDQELIRRWNETVSPEDTVYLETGYARSEDDIRFLERVRALPEELREIVYLKYAQELTMREIAKVLNIPMRTVQSKLRRALGILKCEEERAWGRKNGLKLNSLFLIF